MTNLTLTKGDTFSHTFQINNANGTAADLTGWRAIVTLRTHQLATDSIIVFDTADDSIAPLDNTGKIILSADAATTLALDAANGVYDVVLINGAAQVTAGGGVVYLTTRVTTSVS